MTSNTVLTFDQEDEYIKECVRTIGRWNCYRYVVYLAKGLQTSGTVANPNTPYYYKLMSAMFSQSSDRHKDFTYDYQTVC